MKSRKIIYCIIAFFLLCCCTIENDRQSNNIISTLNAILKPNKIDYKYDLKITDTLHLELDSLAWDVSDFVQYYQPTSESKGQIVYWNPNSRQIYFYSYPEGKIADKIQLESEGPNGVGKGHCQIYYHNPDSIFVVNSHGYRMSLINKQVEIINKYQLSQPPKGYVFTALPFVGTREPLIIMDNHIIISSVSDLSSSETKNFKQFQIFFTINFHNKEYAYFYDYPEPYHKGIYEVDYITVAKTFNKEKKHLVISYKADNYLYETDLKSYNVKHQAKSRFFGDIKPLKERKGGYEYEERSRFYYSSPSYEAVHYDPYRKAYYRFATRGLDETAMLNRKFAKPLSIIILDENFNIIGETDLGPFSDATYIMFFSTPDGFFIRKRSSDEDQMTFLKLELAKK